MTPLQLTIDPAALLKRRDSLQAQLAAQARASGGLLSYGDHDPFDVTLTACGDCGSTPKLVRLTPNGGVRWQVQCPNCGCDAGQPSKHPWTTALSWNGQVAQAYCYTQIPLFSLSGLAPCEAYIRVGVIKANIELRLAMCQVETQLFVAGLSTQKPGVRYSARLGAYLTWAMHAQRLIKRAR